MKRTILLIILLATCMVGIGLNVLTVVTRERALANDSVWRFRIAGFDPLDPFRGRFVEFTVPNLQAIDVDENGEYPYWLTESVLLYVKLGRDDEGFTRIVSFTYDKPDSDGDWLTVRYRGSGEIEPLFTRYYVNESQADALDRQFRTARETAYIMVRISDGVGVITGIGFGSEDSK